MQWIIVVCVVLFFIFRGKPVTTFKTSVCWLNARLSDVPKSQKTDAHLGQAGRISTPLPYDAFSDVYDHLESLLGAYRVVREIPIEHRLYYTGSGGMDWHADVRILPGDYYEVVMTIRNDSDSVFEYQLFGGLWCNKIRPVAGTVVFVRPNDLVHRVTPVTYGSREILKFVVVPTGVISDTHDDALIRHA